MSCVVTPALAFVPYSAVTSTAIHHIIHGFCFAQTTFNMRNGFLITDSCDYVVLVIQKANSSTTIHWVGGEARYIGVD